MFWRQLQKNESADIQPNEHGLKVKQQQQHCCCRRKLQLKIKKNQLLTIAPTENTNFLQKGKYSCFVVLNVWIKLFYLCWMNKMVKSKPVEQKLSCSLILPYEASEYSLAWTSFKIGIVWSTIVFLPTSSFAPRDYGDLDRVGPSR